MELTPPKPICNAIVLAHDECEINGWKIIIPRHWAPDITIQNHFELGASELEKFFAEHHVANVTFITTYDQLGGDWLMAGSYKVREFVDAARVTWGD